MLLADRLRNPAPNINIFLKLNAKLGGKTVRINPRAADNELYLILHRLYSKIKFVLDGKHSTIQLNRLFLLFISLFLNTHRRNCYRTLFIGIDVTHPTATGDMEFPSIAAVVSNINMDATKWVCCKTKNSFFLIFHVIFRYSAKIMTQQERMESIPRMREMFRNQLQKFFKAVCFGFQIYF